MSLWETRNSDAKAIVEDGSAFARSITVTNPAGVSATLLGQVRDIAAQISPETGAVVSGRTASVTLSLVSLAALGLTLPKNIPDKTSKPWVVQFPDAMGLIHVFKVSETLPDVTFGVVVLKLESYKPAATP